MRHTSDERQLPFQLTSCRTVTYRHTSAYTYTHTHPHTRCLRSLSSCSYSFSAFVFIGCRSLVQTWYVQACVCMLVGCLFVERVCDCGVCVCVCVCVWVCVCLYVCVCVRACV